MAYFPTILRNDPFRALFDLDGELGRPWRPADGDAALQPPYDVQETDSHYVLSLDLPGVKKEDIQVELHERQLSVSAERRFERAGAKGSTRYSRAFTLPSTIDPERIEAEHENGVLRLAIPKAEHAKPRQIRIGGGEAGKGFFGRKAS